MKYVTQHGLVSEMTVERRLRSVDQAINLGRRQVMSADACGDRFDAEIYERRVDRLLILRQRELTTSGRVISWLVDAQLHRWVRELEKRRRSSYSHGG